MVATSAVPVSVTLGGKKPLLEELTSSLADAFGVSVPIPTCAIKAMGSNSKVRRIEFLINTFLTFS